MVIDKKLNTIIYESVRKKWSEPELFQGDSCSYVEDSELLLCTHCILSDAHVERKYCKL